MELLRIDLTFFLTVFGIICGVLGGSGGLIIALIYLRKNHKLKEQEIIINTQRIQTSETKPLYDLLAELQKDKEISAKEKESYRLEIENGHKAREALEKRISDIEDRERKREMLLLETEKSKLILERAIGYGIRCTTGEADCPIRSELKQLKLSLYGK